jgi:hypothetical protein
MSVMLMVLLGVDTAREAEMLSGFETRHDQSIRLGALSHEIWKLQAPGEDAGRWLGTMTFRNMDHFSQFSAAQDADPEAQETIGSILGPGGVASILSMRVAESA